MAKRKRSSKRPQPRHKRKGSKSQFDKRRRLDRRNPNRKKTKRAKVPLVGVLAKMASRMASMLDARIAFRLLIVMAGMMLADDRRVAAAWFVAGGVQDDWDRFYDCLISVGRRTKTLALPLLIAVVSKFAPGPGGHLTLGIDDTPTQRYGPDVEGAGVHHNPTPGPADGKWLYGHNWVALCVLATHSLWGVIALPMQSLLYVRAKDCPRLERKHGWEFRTKHQLAVELVTWFVTTARSLGARCKFWVVADGAYAAGPFLRPLAKLGVVVFSRLRKDAKLFDLPPERVPGERRGRGRPPVYGKKRIHLAKRAAHREGWESITYHCRGGNVTRQYKTFLATSPFAGGPVRVVIVKFDDGGWAPYFCTDPNVEVRDILETVAARWAIEEHFHDVKEVWGAGQQQVRNVWSNIGCWHLNQWLYTMVELCSWDAAKSEVTSRSDRPWDNPQRRPSHADRRRAISRKMLETQFLSHLPNTPESEKIQRVIADLIELAA